ncbi:MAG: 16S rRNA (cytosine(967)-C(5))-methyltransferase RsmB [Lachnospiraceae bacterium]
MRENGERAIVLAVLTDVSDGQMADQALHRELAGLAGPENAQKRRFISRLTRTVIERTITLDYFLDFVAEKPMKEQKPEIAWILRMAAAQILYFDSVPDSAAVNEAVNLAARYGQGAKAFVNGVLRSFLRRRGEFALPDPHIHPDKYLQIRYSLPNWIEQEIVRVSGDTAPEEVMAGFLAEAPLFIRVNTSRISAERLREKLTASGITVNGEPLPGLLSVSDFGSVEAMPGFSDGEFYVQDISSAAAYRSAGFAPRSRVLDVCGAPGGKSVQAALAMREGGRAGEICCCDISDERLKRTRDNVSRLGLTEIETRKRSAAEEHPEDAGRFDAVITDVPCSGIGDLRRKPDIRLRITRADSRELVPVQRKIMACAFPAVRPGGKLIYSTCTIVRAENQGNAKWFEEHFPVKLCSEKLYLPSEKWPGDGFYAALFERLK